MQTIPQDLHKAITAKASVDALWNGLTPIARRDFISWIESAKQPKTRVQRIERVPSMLMSGKRRPCCYAVVPMNMYTALGKNPKAKAQWKDLDPNERRDFTDWIESAKDSNVRTERIDKACSMLAAKKRHP